MRLYRVRELPDAVRSMVVGVLGARDTDFLARHDNEDVSIVRPATHAFSGAVCRCLDRLSVAASSDLTVPVPTQLPPPALGPPQEGDRFRVVQGGS
jgi:hypothetical protein